jgi:hypothetical protein
VIGFGAGFSVVDLVPDLTGIRMYVFVGDWISVITLDNHPVFSLHS